MKVIVYSDEWHPVYSISDDGLPLDNVGEFEIEITEEQFAFIKKAEEDFTKSQELIHAALYLKKAGV